MPDAELVFGAPGEAHPTSYFLLTPSYFLLLPYGIFTSTLKKRVAELVGVCQVASVRLVLPWRV